MHQVKNAERVARTLGSMLIPFVFVVTRRRPRGDRSAGRETRACRIYVTNQSHREA
jgi:hypothetical protein